MIAALWSRFSAWIIGAVGLIAAVAAVYMRGRSAGKEAEQKKATVREHDQERAMAAKIQEVSNVQTEVARLPDASVRQRLQKWTRDH